MNIDEIILSIPNRLKPIEYIKTKNGCYECISHKADKNGYIDMCINNNRVKLHRYIYSKFFNNIKDNEVVRHRCDNASCINPEHLEIGSHRDNVEDRCKRGRSAVGTSHGRNKLTEQQVKEIRSNEKDSISKLSRMYGVDRKNIRLIKQFKTWNWL